MIALERWMSSEAVRFHYVRGTEEDSMTEKQEHRFWNQQPWVQFHTMLRGCLLRVVHL